MSARYGLAESPSGVGIVAAETYILASNGDGTWSPVPQGGGGGAVTSVFTRTGAVESATGDYVGSQVSNDSGVSGDTVSDALDNLQSSIAVDSVFNRTGAVVAVNGDYTSSLITNLSSVTGATVTNALNSLKTSIDNGVVSVFTRVGAVVAVNGDYTSSLITNLSSVTGATVTNALNRLSGTNGITNQSGVDGVSLTNALDTLNLIAGYTSFLQSPFAVIAAPGFEISPNPLPAGLYQVSVSLTNTSTNTAGAISIAVTGRDQNGDVITKAAVAALASTALLANSTGSVILESDGTDSFKAFTSATTPLVGNVNVHYRISVLLLGRT